MDEMCPWCHCLFAFWMNSYSKKTQEELLIIPESNLLLQASDIFYTLDDVNFVLLRSELGVCRKL